MKPKRGSNRLFLGLLVFSLLVHGAVFLQIAGVCRSRALTFIDLTLEDALKLAERNIPRPRPRPKQQPEPLDPSTKVMETPPLPLLKPMKNEPAESVLPERLIERIEVASVPQVPGALITGAELGSAESLPMGDYDTANAYLEMVRMRIEKHKRYPAQARAAFREGRVVVRFTITTQGDLHSLDVRRSSRTRALDEAALEAVRSAAPFPAPPRHLFKGDIPLELAVVFELT